MYEKWLHKLCSVKHLYEDRHPERWPIIEKRIESIAPEWRREYLEKIKGGRIDD